MIGMGKKELLCFISQEQPICNNKVCRNCAVNPWNNRWVADSPSDYYGIDEMHRRKYAIELYLQQYGEEGLFEVLL